MTSEPIRRGRHERWISLERWWPPPEVTFTSKSVRFSAAAPIAAKCVRRQHMQPSKDRRYSITSSARASSVGGTSMPSALAVVRFMTRSNFVGCAFTLLYHLPELVQRAQIIRPWRVSESLRPVGPRHLADIEVAVAVHRKPMRRQELGWTKARAKPA